MSWLWVSAVAVSFLVSINSYSFDSNNRATDDELIRVAQRNSGTGSTNTAPPIPPDRKARNAFRYNSWKSICLARSNSQIPSLKNISQRVHFQVSTNKKHALIEYFFYKDSHCRNLVDRREVVLDVKKLKFTNASTSEKRHYYYEFSADHVFVQQSKADEPEDWDFTIDVTRASRSSKIYLAKGNNVYIEMHKDGRVAHNGNQRFGRIAGNSAHKRNSGNKGYNQDITLRKTQRVLYSNSLPIPDLFPNQAMGLFLRLDSDFQNKVGPNFTQWNRESDQSSYLIPYGYKKAEQRVEHRYQTLLRVYEALPENIQASKGKPVKEVVEYPRIEHSILVTAFGKWKSNRSKNGSKVLAEEVARQVMGDPQWDHINFQYCVLDVDYKLATEQLARCYSQMNPKPSYVISLGESDSLKCDNGQSESFKIDVVAKNYLKGRSSDTVQYRNDESGKGRGDIWAGSHLPDVISTNIPMHEAFCALPKYERSSIKIAYDSGSYVCNTTSYQMLMTLKMFPELQTQFSFIHTPIEKCLRSRKLESHGAKLKSLIASMMHTKGMRSVDYATQSKSLFHQSTPRFPKLFPRINKVSSAASSQIKSHINEIFRLEDDLNAVKSRITAEQDFKNRIKRIERRISEANDDLDEFLSKQSPFTMTSDGDYLIYEHYRTFSENVKVPSETHPGRYTTKKVYKRKHVYTVEYNIYTQTHFVETHISGYPQTGKYRQANDGIYYYNGRDGRYIYDLNKGHYRLETGGGYIDFTPTNIEKGHWSWTPHKTQPKSDNPLLSDRNKCMGGFFQSILEGQARSRAIDYKNSLSKDQIRRMEGTVIENRYDRDMFPTD